MNETDKEIVERIMKEEKEWIESLYQKQENFK